MRGINPVTVSRYFSSGKLDKSVLTPDGKIRVSRAEKMLKDRIAPIQRESSKSRFKHEDKEAVIKQAGLSNGISIAEAQRLFMSYKAALKKLDYEERTGKLGDIKKMEMAVFNMARRTRDAVLNIPDRVAAILAAENLTEDITKDLDQ
jgi:hypothetical protein